jgi:uncharacterized RDD family membrane protein YckC
MKCPKCGYLGFETTDRCRNCQYDFSLAPFLSETDLSLKTAEHSSETNGSFELPAITRTIDVPPPNSLDLDRLFGVDEESTPPVGTIDFPESTGPTIEVIDDPGEHLAVAEAVESVEPVESVDPAEPPAAAGESLPFDDAPIVPPPAARAPLSVRRATTELPRHRPRPTRPARPEPLQLEPETESERAGSGSTAETIASLMERPTLGARVGAGAIDTVLLMMLDAAILYLTLRVTGLQNTIEDVRVLPIIPFGGFLALLAFGYVAAFTVAGGQTIGKMLLSLRVIGDDGRPIDAAGGMLRAAGCMLVPLTFGLSYVPALVTSDHRALHDRLAGTRVVRD